MRYASPAARCPSRSKKSLVVGVENSDRDLVKRVEADDHPTQGCLHGAAGPTVAIYQFNRPCRGPYEPGKTRPGPSCHSPMKWARRSG